MLKIVYLVPYHNCFYLPAELLLGCIQSFHTGWTAHRDLCFDMAVTACTECRYSGDIVHILNELRSAVAASDFVHCSHIRIVFLLFSLFYDTK